MGNDGIIVSDIEPTTLDKVTWLKIFPGGSREWREFVNGSWVLTDTEPAPASADHNHGGINFAHDGGKMEITKLTIVNGVVTELEYDI